MKAPTWPCLPGLFSETPRQMAEASLEGWERILATLAQREQEVLLALCEAIEHSRFVDFTGMELAEVSGLSVLNIRPRLTGLRDQGLVERGSIRTSRVLQEQRAHPYRPCVPRSAIEHWRRTTPAPGRG